MKLRDKLKYAYYNNIQNIIQNERQTFHVLSIVGIICLTVLFTIIF